MYEDDNQAAIDHINHLQESLNEMSELVGEIPYQFEVSTEMNKDELDLAKQSLEDALARAVELEKKRKPTERRCRLCRIGPFADNVCTICQGHEESTRNVCALCGTDGSTMRSPGALNRMG